MHKRVVIIIGALMFVVGFYSVVMAAGFKAGQWSMTMVTKIEGSAAETAEMKAAMKEMEDMPPQARAMMEKMQGAMGVKMGVGAEGITTTITQCITDQNPVPDTKMPKNCKQTHEIKGHTVTFTTVCKDKNSQMDSSGKMTYSGDSMKGQIKSHQVTKGQTMDTTVQITGKYLGPCKK